MTNDRQPELCYLACPYSHADPAVRKQRYEAATRAAARLIMQGEHVYSPLSNSHRVAETCDLPLDWAFWEPLDRAFIAHSSRLYVLTLPGWNESKGVLAEIAIAEKLAVPVIYLPANFWSDGEPVVVDTLPRKPARSRLPQIPKTDWSQTCAAKPFTTEPFENYQSQYHRTMEDSMPTLDEDSLLACSYIVLTRFGRHATGSWFVAGYGKSLADVAGCFRERSLFYHERPVILAIDQVKAVMSGQDVVTGNFDVFAPRGAPNSDMEVCIEAEYGGRHAETPMAETSAH